MSPVSGRIGGMQTSPLFHKIDAVTVAVPDLESGLHFYRDCLGHQLVWRNDDIGQVGLMMPGSDTEIVLATGQEYAPNWLVTSVDEATRLVASAGGRVLTGPFDIPVGRAAVVADPFGNVLVMVDLSKGRYLTDSTGRVTGLASEPPAGIQ
jgi:predicted enzyme related to lactoylglutathione lyase